MKELNNNDEWYTPDYGVEILLEFLKPSSKILCPFDKDWSAYYKVLTENGHSVTISHIEDGKDFFEYTKKEVEEYDYIVSNPPYSLRRQVISHLEYLDKPFAMLVPLVTIAITSIRKQLENKELLVFDARIKFRHMSGKTSGGPSELAYFCKQVLPSQILYRELKPNFVDSRQLTLF